MNEKKDWNEINGMISKMLIKYTYMRRFTILKLLQANHGNAQHNLIDFCSQWMMVFLWSGSFETTLWFRRFYKYSFVLPPIRFHLLMLTNYRQILYYWLHSKYVQVCTWMNIVPVTSNEPALKKYVNNFRSFFDWYLIC